MSSVRARCWKAGLVGLGIPVVLAALALMALGHKPAFYTQAVGEDPSTRTESKRFLQRGMQLRNDIANDTRWEAVFRESELNAWLAEDRLGAVQALMPPSAQTPRVSFERERVTVAFTFRDAPVPTVVWAVLQIGVEGPNQLSLTVERLRAGAMPVPSSWFRDQITAVAAGLKLDVTWQRQQGRDVAVLNLRQVMPVRQMRLESVQVQNGWLRVLGYSGPDQMARGDRTRRGQPLGR